ncbi:MAG: diaminopropionate ammonia-lyase, partial [Oscillospiraceae bacterium]|nr:diaminopropionate ammonia-lyase [Oscillospiraceae bacterium]
MSIQSIRIITNRRNGIANADITDFNTAWAKKVRKYHDSFPEYAETPLCELRSLSEYLDLGSVFVKDESKRFGLNAFKVLGGSYCLGRLLAEIAGIPEREMTYSRLIQP